MAEIQELMIEKATELFNVCDQEGRGYITRDQLLKRLGTELPLDQQQLSAVFDKLDDDGNGYLTLEEFTDGFGAFLGMGSDYDEPDEAAEQKQDAVYESGQYNSDDDVDNSENFDDLMRQCGGYDVIEDPELVREVWVRLKKQQPDLVQGFEEFITKVSCKTKHAYREQQNLESALKLKLMSHDEDIKKLYEEMELQIKAERKRILDEEYTKEKQLKEELTSELQSKERHLQDLTIQRTKMQERLEIMQNSNVSNCSENERLIRENGVVLDKLEKTSCELREMKQYAEQLRSQSMNEKKERARSAFKVTEGIAKERESLVRQLDNLREENKLLKDERDESSSNWRGSAFIHEMEFEEDDDRVSHHSSMHNLSVPAAAHERRGSIVSDYVDGSMSGSRDMLDTFQSSMDDTIEYDEVVEDYTPRFDSRSMMGARRPNMQLDHSPTVIEEIYGERQPPIGALAADADPECSLANPKRIFKIVFVGESGAGKTTFIHQFCNNKFRAVFSATIGVDFQTKTLKVDDHVMALQLWDTAGQERFHCITSQYFRRADGVIIMYDITNTASFLAVRNWVLQIKEEAGERPVLMVIGNKIDKENRTVGTKEGERISNELKTLFFEVSSFDGKHVLDSIQSLALKLQEKEDEEIEMSLHLVPVVRKKKCCTC